LHSLQKLLEQNWSREVTKHLDRRNSGNNDNIETIGLQQATEDSAANATKLFM
jgi:hypothetical protein